MPPPAPLPGEAGAAFDAASAAGCVKPEKAAVLRVETSHDRQLRVHSRAAAAQIGL